MEAQLNHPVRNGLSFRDSYCGYDSTCPVSGREDIKCLDCELKKCLLDLYQKRGTTLSKRELKQCLA